MVVNALSAIGLSIPQARTGDVDGAGAERSEARGTEESTPLLGAAGQASRPPALLFSTPPSPGVDLRFFREPYLTLGQFLRAPAAWMLAFVLFAAVGGAEMVMSSIGSMVVSLKPGGTTECQQDNVRLGKETLAIRAQQVQLLGMSRRASETYRRS